MEIKKKYQKTTDSPNEFLSLPPENERPTIVSKPRTNSFEKGNDRSNRGMIQYFGD